MSSPVDQAKRQGVAAPNTVSGAGVITHDQLVARQQQAAARASQAQQQQDQPQNNNNNVAVAKGRARRGGSGTPSWAQTAANEKQAAADKKTKDDAEYSAIFAGFKEAKKQGAAHGVDVASADVNISGNTVTVKNAKGVQTQAAKDQADRARNNAIIDQEIANLKATGADVNGANIKVSNTPSGNKAVSVSGVKYQQSATAPPTSEYTKADYNVRFGTSGKRIGDIVQEESAKGDRGLYAPKAVYEKKAVDAFVSDYSSYLNRKAFADSNVFLSPDPTNPFNVVALPKDRTEVIAPDAMHPFKLERQLKADVSLKELGLNENAGFGVLYSKQFAKSGTQDLVKDTPASTGGMFGDVIDFGKGAGAQAGNYARDFVNTFGDPFAKAYFNVKAGKDYAQTPETDIITLGTKDLFNFQGRNGKVIVPDNGITNADYAKVAANYAKNPAYNTGALAITAATFLPKKAYEGINFLGKGLGLVADTSKTDKLAVEATAHMRNLKALDAGYSGDRVRFGRATIDPLHDTSAVGGGMGKLAKGNPLSAFIGGGSVKVPTAFNTLYIENNFGIKPDLSEHVRINTNFAGSGSSSFKTIPKSDLFPTNSRTNNFGIKADLFEGASMKSFVGVPAGGYLRPTLESDILVKRPSGKGGSDSGFKFDAGSGFGSGSGSKPSGIKSVGDTFKEIKTSNGLILLVKQESQQASLKADTLGMFAPQKTVKKVRINPSLSEKVDLGFGSGSSSGAISLIKVSKRKQVLGGMGSFSLGSYSANGKQDQISRQIQRMLQDTQTQQATKRKGKYRQAQQIDQLFDLSQVSKQTTKQAQRQNLKQTQAQSLIPKSMLASLQGLQFKIATKQTTKQAQGAQYKYKQDATYKFKTDQAFKFDFKFDRTLNIPDTPVPKIPSEQKGRKPFPLPIKLAGAYRRAGGRRKRGNRDYMQEFNVKDLVSVAAGENSPFAKAFNRQFKNWF